MTKQTKRIGLAIIYTLVALFIGGCSSKSDIGYDNTAGNTSNNSNSNSGITNHANSISADDSGLSYINKVTSNVNGKSVTLNSVHFAFDKYTLSDEMRVIVKNNNKVISPIIIDNKDLKIKLEGNCDEWGTDEYNYALGLKRAKTVKDALVNEGIPANKIILVTLGESNPLCTSKENACWKKNRRVDHRLLP